MRANKAKLAFVRALLAGAEAECVDARTFRLHGKSGPAHLRVTDVEALAATGVVVRIADRCRKGPGAKSWLRRQLLEPEARFADQHRVIVTGPGGAMRNLAESPLARLAAPMPGGTEPYLSPAQVEAGERVRRLVERARLQPRLTMSYSAMPAPGGPRSGAPEISDLAADARRALAEITLALPRECAGVVLDVCGLLKGLQTVEAERGWPRRSAKLVLRIGLDHLAHHFGLSDHAQGRNHGHGRSWIEEGGRPTEMG